LFWWVIGNLVAHNVNEMSLTLTVLSFKNRPLSETKTAFIGSEGGSIGRSDDNTLMLPDTEKFVSRHHASIKAENGAYYLTDTSLSGVYINGEEPALHNATERLDNGTVLKIGEYEIAVAITTNEPVVDDFLPFAFESITPPHNEFLSVDEPWVESENLGANSLMTDNFPSHEELVQTESDRQPINFKSNLEGNQSPLFDSYIAPSIISSPVIDSSNVIPENFSFDDLFSANEQESTNQVVNKPTVNDDFDDFFGAAISGMGTEIDQSAPISEIAIEHNHDAIEPVELLANKNTLSDEPPLVSSSTESNLRSLIDETPTELNQTSNAFDLFADPNSPIEPAHFDDAEIAALISEPLTENAHKIGAVEWTDEKSPAFEIEPPFSSCVNTPAFTSPETNNHHEDKKEPVLVAKPVIENTKLAPADSVLFNAFLQGAKIECNKIHPEQQAETLHRIGQMFRKLIDGTVAVLRSRAEFKSLCRVNMTVIKAADNNPLKFTVSTDDVLRQLLENKTDGFLTSTAAIEESFNDIMNHQLAMQAGIQASLADLLQTFDPKVIEKQFEQGLVLQKKAKCWESYEKTYHNTVEDAVENFFGDAFVDAYEKQMQLLTKSRKK